jgi:multiple sugar transport system substrate-binding protein
MNRISRRLVRLAERGLVLVLLLAPACSSSDDKTDNKPVTITYYRHDDIAVSNADKYALEAYTKAHPNVTVDLKVVNYDALLALLESDFTAGTVKADLINMPPSYACGYAARLLPIPVSSVSAEERAAFLPAPLEGATCNGTLMGLPREYNLEYGGILVNMTYYRSKITGRTPADWRTWGDVVTDAKQLTQYDPNGKVTVAGLEFRHRDPIKHILLALILQQGGKFWNEQRNGFTFNTPEARTALKWLADAAQVDKYVDREPARLRFLELAIRLVQDQVGMLYIGTWGHAIATEAARMQNRTVELQYFKHPPFLGTEHAFVQNAGWSLVVPKNSENAAAALELARFLTLDPTTVVEWNRLAGSIPALRTLTTPAALAADPVRAGIQPLLELGRWVGYIPPRPLTETRDSWFNNTLWVMQGLIKAADGSDQPFAAEQAAAKIEAECNESMARAR